MIDTKELIKDGFKKVSVALMIDRDRNGKEHITVIDTVEHAKTYSNAQIRQATMYIKID